LTDIKHQQAVARFKDLMRTDVPAIEYHLLIDDETGRKRGEWVSSTPFPRIDVGDFIHPLIFNTEWPQHARVLSVTHHFVDFGEQGAGLSTYMNIVAKLE